MHYMRFFVTERMKDMMKKLLSMVLALVLVLSMLPTATAVVQR